MKALIEQAGATLIFQPPYSPDMNPIELAWSKVKWFLRIAKAGTRDGINNAIGMVMDLITPDEAAGWFRHCGYTNQVF